VRSLAETVSSQRWARSSGASETRGVTGKLRTRRDTRPLRGSGSGPSAGQRLRGLGFDQRDQVAVLLGVAAVAHGCDTTWKVSSA
jgi:hypothetical protein